MMIRTMSTAAVIVSSSFDDEHRASMLVGADLFYSGGGYLIISLTTYFSAAGYIWNSGYLAISGVSAAIFCLALVARYPKVSDDTAVVETTGGKTDFAFVTGVAEDIGNTTYEGGLAFQVVRLGNATPEIFMRLNDAKNNLVDIFKNLDMNTNNIDNVYQNIWCFVNFLHLCYDFISNYTLKISNHYRIWMRPYC